MKILEFRTVVVIIAFTTQIISCTSPVAEKENTISYELSAIGKDTVNIIDTNGKQGLWIPSPSNKLQDTVYYKNDSIID